GLIDIKNIKNKNFWEIKKRFEGIKSKEIIRAKEILYKIFMILTRVIFIIGIIFAINVLFGVFEILTTGIVLFTPQFGTFFSFIFLANTIIYLKLKLKKKKWNPKKYYRTAIIGILVSGISMMPFFLTHSIVFNAEKKFVEMFGQDWREQIPVEVNSYFLQTPFSIPGYFLGLPPKSSIIEEQTLFYEGEGISLYFDAYMPLNRGKKLPGENSTIIRIHGGGWVSGDKGHMNMMQMNKYFAAQGYIVFDIQYGLFDGTKPFVDSNTPDYNLGDFSIDDMMRHLGIFTIYLAEHADEYGAKLDSVFVSGGSSGGHLASAMALAIASEKYTDIFSQNLTIKGLIPFYPANGQMVYFGIDGKEEFKNPESLIEEDSPPCLIFQGTHDILNYFSITNNFRNTYLAEGNDECVILWMLLGKRTSLICYFYLVFMIFAMLSLMSGNLSTSVTYSNEVIENFGAYLTTYFSYFGILIFGIFIGLIDIKNIKNKNFWEIKKRFEGIKSKEIIRAKEILYKIFMILTRVIFIIGIIFAINVLF
ncbi:unnamed protein product, partial [marine sediment metagenome]